ncbi:rCG46944, isoform CRA_b [Rattus norvegicus]|uniref:RCG46944, isoform CRA_b n=1 Tax=Rattus norvegicus TaxID=10116 RepID=A6IX96_RAT|nr:rCG46944, isoform CRA_b [Rattus norvegicus]
MKGDMDLSVLPNNNHPDKFLQLDVKSLMRSSTLLQASLARFPGGNYPATQHWQNLVYSQSPGASQRKSVRWSEKPAMYNTPAPFFSCCHTHPERFYLKAEFKFLFWRSFLQYQTLHYACIPRRQRGRHMYYWGGRKEHCYSTNQGIWWGEPSPS